MTLIHVLSLALILFGIGLYGLLTRRHLIGMLLSIELMLNATNINFIAFSRFQAADGSAGQVFSLFVIAISACEVAIALAIIINLYRRHKHLDVSQLEQLHG